MSSFTKHSPPNCERVDGIEDGISGTRTVSSQGWLLTENVLIGPDRSFECAFIGCCTRIPCLELRLSAGLCCKWEISQHIDLDKKGGFAVVSSLSLCNWLFLALHKHSFLVLCKWEILQ